MSQKANTASGSKFASHMVNQSPRFEHRVVTSRSTKIRRPDKRQKKPKFL